MKRLTTITGILTLTFSPLVALAAPEAPTDPSANVNVTVQLCRTLLAPHSFSTQKEREHQEWHDMHEIQRTKEFTAWQTAHTTFHREQRQAHILYTRQLVACGNLLETRGRQTVSRFDLFVLRPLERRGFVPMRLTQTGGIPRTIQAEPRFDTPWRDPNFAGNNRPSRRTIVEETLESQVRTVRF